MKTSTASAAPTNTTLRGPWLTVARATWFALVVLTLAIWTASLSPFFDEMRTVCIEDECARGILSPQEADALRDAGLSMEFYAGFQVGIGIFSALIHTLLAGVIFWRRSDDWMGIFVSLTLLMIGTFFFSDTGSSLVRRYLNLSLLIELLFALATTSFVLLFYLFPDGRFVPRWTRWLAAVLGAGLVIAAVPEGLSWLTPPWSAGVYSLMLGSFIAGLFAQIYRYRRVSGPVQRQQTKWVVFGLGAAVLVIFIWSFGFELFPLPPGPARLYVNLFGVGIIFLVLLLFPLSLAIAILRYRLWDIDVLINRTMVYGALTGALAAVYFGSVVLLQGLFRALTGQESQIAVVASTLAIAALFAPLRRRVQNFIDRRFYRRKYDAEQVLAEFAATVRDEVDLDKLTAELLRVVEETLQPAHVSLWLAPTADDRRQTAVDDR